MDKAAQLKEFLVANGISPAELAKATGDYAGLAGIKVIEDLWDDIHRVPPAKETTTGPSMVSSGAGADAGMRNYSNPAPQVGITKEYERLAGHTADWEDVKATVKAGFAELLKEVKKSVAKDADPDADADPGKASKKDADPDADADPGKSIAKDADPDADPARKSRSIASLYTRLSKAEEEAAETESKHGHDKEKMSEAKSYISKAENYIEQVEVAKSGSQRELYILRAESSLGKAFEAIMKARPVERHGLKGDGNQSDTAIPGSVREAEAKARYWTQKVAHMKGTIAKDADPDADPDPDPGKKATAKDADPDADADPGKASKKDADPGKAMYCARFHGPESRLIKAAADHFMASSQGQYEPANSGAHKAVKDALRRYAGYLDLGKAGKDPDPDPDPDPGKAAMKDADPDADADPGKSVMKDADPDADPGKKASMKDADPDADADPGKAAMKDADPDADPKMKSYMKSINERMRLIEQNLSANQNRPTITPIILQKSGITTDSLAERMHDDVAKWNEDGLLTDEDATIADSIIDRFRSVGKGNVGITSAIVGQQLEQSPIPVRQFFEHYNGN